MVDDFVEVTSQPLEIVTSATDSMTSSNEAMLTSPDDMIMSHMMGNPLDDPDINMVSDIMNFHGHKKICNMKFYFPAPQTINHPSENNLKHLPS